MTRLVTILTFILLALSCRVAHGAVSTLPSAYDRVIQTRTLRCGYGYWAPGVVRNEKTGALQGLFVDYMEALGRTAGLKIVWAEEVDWGNIPSALSSGRIDAMCAGVWPDAVRGLYLAFTRPVYYNTIEAFVRVDDHRFDGDHRLLNTPSVTIAVVEGDSTAAIAAHDFPNAKIYALSQLQGGSDLLMSVAAKKADVGFYNTGMAHNYMERNPGKLRRLAPHSPLRVYGGSIAIDIHETELLSLLNTASDELLNGGIVDRLLKPYEKTYPDTFLIAPKPYAARPY